MQPLFLTPATPGRWLLGSLGWAALAAGLWHLGSAYAAPGGPGALLLATLTQALAWGRAVPGGRALLRRAAPTALVQAASAWWLLLHLALFATLFLTLRALFLLWLAATWPAGNL